MAISWAPSVAVIVCVVGVTTRPSKTLCDGPFVIVSTAFAASTELSGAVATAVIVTPPGVIAVTSPDGLIVAIEALLVCQVACPVRFCVAGLPLL